MPTPTLDRRDARIDAVLWAATAAIVLAVVILSFTTDSPGEHAFPGVDKVQHAGAYLAATLGLWLAGVWRPGRGRGPWWNHRGWVPAAILAAGAAIEVLQAASGRRDGDVLDWLAEVIGVVAAIALVEGLRRRTEHPVADR